MPKEIKVLDKGFVRTVDVMGNDAAICHAARVSYAAGTKSVSDDRSLIRYLMRHKHLSPFEMCEIKLHVKLPIFVMRQLIRHRTANVNEMSARYSEMPSDFYLPELERIKPQSTKNKQGSDDVGNLKSSVKEAVRNVLSFCQDAAYEAYNKMLESNVARELARINLPVSLYTECYWKCDLRNIFNLLSLRLDSHAQEEFQVYAKAIAEIVKELFPMAYEAFEDYWLHAVTLSRQEVQLMALLLESQNLHERGDEIAILLDTTSRTEVAEFREKLRRFESVAL